MIYSGKMHLGTGMYFMDCLHVKSCPYICTTMLVKLSGNVSCAAIPVWDKKDFFTLRSSHFYSRKSVPKGNYAGVAGCSCAVHWAEWWGYASALPSAGFSPPCSPVGALLGSVFSATLAGFLS